MHSKFKHVRSLRLWHLAGFLVLALFLVIAGIALGARTAHTDYGCLQVDSFVSRTLIDLRAGLRADKVVSEQRLASAGSSVVRPIGWSPDRQHVAYVQDYADPAGGLHTGLFVRSTRWAGVGDPMLIERDASPSPWSPQLTWSPDSRYFAYSWRLDNGQYMVGVASPDGQKYTTIAGNSLVILHGWSADGVYFVYFLNPGGLRVWRRDTGQFIDADKTVQVAGYERQNFSSFVESPRGHQLAYLSPEPGGKNRLVIDTPEGDTPITFDLPNALFKPVLFWSPDGRYVAVASLPEQGASLWRLSVFGVDGTRYADISERVSGHFPPSSLPEVRWAADGSSLVYMEVPDGDDFHARLVAFHVDSGQSQILLTGVRANVFYMPDGRYMQTAWESGSRTVAGFVDVTTGASHPLIDYDSQVGPDLWPSPDGRIVAVAPIPGSGKGLQLLATDGAWQRSLPVSARATAGALEEYGLTWSPDSTLLAVTHRVVAYGVYELDVVRLDGTSVYHADAISSYPPDVTWTHCEAE